MIRLTPLLLSLHLAGSAVNTRNLSPQQLSPQPKVKMLPDHGEADSFYYDALADYLDSCDATTELYAEGKVPDAAALIAEGLRFSSAFKKLAYVVKVANGKFGKRYIMPHFFFDTKYWEKVQ